VEGGFHPPVPTRIKKLRDEALGFFDDANPRESHRVALEASREVVDEWMRKLPEDDGLPPQIEAVVDRALTMIDDTVLGEASFGRDLFQQQLGPVWDALTAGIAPAEIVFHRDMDPLDETPASTRPHSDWSEPCDWRSILNGCYLRWLSERKGFDGVDCLRKGSAMVEERLQRCEHARGAIELSELHRAMLQQREQLRGMEIALK
jgi:hypothetical protein